MTKNLKSQMSNLKHNRGTTIVELLIYMGMFTIILSVLTAIFVTTVNIQLESEALSSVQQDGRYITARLFYDINRAQAITTPVLASQSANLNLTIGGLEYAYSIDGNSNFTITSNSVTDNLNSFNTSVSNLSFKQIGNTGGRNTVQVDFTITSKVKKDSGIESSDFHTTVGLRDNL